VSGREFSYKKDEIHRKSQKHIKAILRILVQLGFSTFDLARKCREKENMALAAENLGSLECSKVFHLHAGRTVVCAHFAGTQRLPQKIQKTMCVQQGQKCAKRTLRFRCTHACHAWQTLCMVLLS